MGDAAASSSGDAAAPVLPADLVDGSDVELEDNVFSGSDGDHTEDDGEIHEGPGYDDTEFDILEILTSKVGSQLLELFASSKPKATAKPKGHMFSDLDESIAKELAADRVVAGRAPATDFALLARVLGERWTLLHLYFISYVFFS